MALKDWRRMRTKSPKWESKHTNRYGGKNRIELEKKSSILGGKRWFAMLIRLNSLGQTESWAGARILINQKGGVKFKKHAIQDARQYMKLHKL